MIRKEVVYHHDYRPEGGGGYSSADLSVYRQLGIGLEEAIELRRRRDVGDDIGRRITNARAFGVPRADIDEALAVNEPALEAYVKLRQDGLDHPEAIAAITGLHVHRGSISRRTGGFDPVLGTGEMTLTIYCECGEPMGGSTTRRNWSGD